MLMLQRILGEEEVAFWYGLDLEIVEELELKVPTPDILLDDVGRRVQWGLEPEPAEKGPPLLALGQS